MVKVIKCIKNTAYSSLSNGGGTVHVFVPNRHGTGISVRCMRPYKQIQAIHTQSRRGARSNATLFDNCQQKNSECRELST